MSILLGAMALGAAMIGAGGHLNAKETNEKAESIFSEAKSIYNNAKRSLDTAKEGTERSLLTLGQNKKRVLGTSMKQFMDSYNKIRHIRLTDSAGMKELSALPISEEDVVEITKLTDIYSSLAQSGAAGAATGALVALAVNGSLPVLEGSMLAAGEIGAATGIAGSTLAFGAAVTPFAAVAAPVVLFTGISASMKADENLEKANAEYAEAEAAAEKMKNSEILCNAIGERADMFSTLLDQLNEIFEQCTGLLAAIVRKKEGVFFKKQLTTEDFTEEELKLAGATGSLAKAIKAVINTPILSSDGTLSEESQNVLENTEKKDMLKLTNDAYKAINAVKAMGDDIKPIKPSASSFSNANSEVSGNAVLWWSKNILSIIAGIAAAFIFSGLISKIITYGKYKVLFLNGYTVNKIAVWMLICFSIVMIFGQFQGSIVEKISKYGISVAMFVLYIVYCRRVENMTHYIIFSLIFEVVFYKLCVYLRDTDIKLCFKEMAFYETSLLIAWPIAFLVYAFFTNELNFSKTFCIVVTSAVVLLWSLGVASESIENSEK